MKFNTRLIVPTILFSITQLPDNQYIAQDTKTLLHVTTLLINNQVSCPHLAEVKQTNRLLQK